MKMRYWLCDVRRGEDVTTHRNVTTDNRHSALGTALLTSQQCRTRLQNLPARIANILVHSRRQTLQHSNMILRSESTRAELVLSHMFINATGSLAFTLNTWILEYFCIFMSDLVFFWIFYRQHRLKVSLTEAPKVNSSWWQVWASVLVIWSGLCWGEERS